MARPPRKKRVVIKDLPVPARDLNKKEMIKVRGGS